MICPKRHSNSRCQNDNSTMQAGSKYTKNNILERKYLISSVFAEIIDVLYSKTPEFSLIYFRVLMFMNTGWIRNFVLDGACRHYFKCFLCVTFSIYQIQNFQYKITQKQLQLWSWISTKTYKSSRNDDKISNSEKYHIENV